MKTIIRIEEFAKFILAYCLSIQLGYAIWLFPLLLITPDLSMLAYLINTKIGAIVYNIFHLQSLAIVIGLVGFFLHIPQLQLAGIVLFGHSAMDRTLGYGLKYEDNFKHTHLGWIGN